MIHVGDPSVVASSENRCVCNMYECCFAIDSVTTDTSRGVSLGSIQRAEVTIVDSDSKY